MMEIGAFGAALTLGTTLWGAYAPNARLFGPVIGRGPDEPLVFLTFDDGPNGRVTERVLDVLAQERVPATFFMLGKHVELYPTTAAAVAQAGHEIGNHTYSHLKLHRTGPQRAADEVRWAHHAITGVTGYVPRSFRAPHGYRSPFVSRAVAPYRYRSFGWTFGVRDSDCPGTELIRKRVRNRLSPGAIILLHDGDGYNPAGDRWQTATALPGIIRDVSGGLRVRGAFQPGCRVRRRSWIVVALLVIGAVLLVRFGLAFPWAATLAALGEADPVLLAGAGLLNIGSLLAKGSVWYLLLRRLAPVRHSTAQSATFVGAAVNAISVAVSGEAARAQVVNGKDGVPFSVAAASLVATRVVEAIGLMVFLIVSLAVVQPWPKARLMALGLAGLAVVVSVGYRLIPRARWHPIIVGLAPGAGAWWALPIGLAGCNWLAQWLTYHWSIQATHVAVTPAVSLMALVAANVAGIPRLTPGNIGVTQGSIILGMRIFGIPPAQGLAAGLALQAVQVLPIMAIAVGIVGTRGLRQLASRRARPA